MQLAKNILGRSGVLVVALTAALLAAVDTFSSSIVVPNLLQDFMTLSLSIFVEAFPFLVLGSLIAAVVNVYVPPHTFEKILPMTISVGDTLPEAEFFVKVAGNIEKLSTHDLFANRKVVLFGLPGAYTPTCESDHLPGYLEHLDTIKSKGVDEIAAAIRKTAHESGVPIHQDPTTARALFSTVSIGQEIPEDQYRAVAAAIRFAEQMRQRAKRGV